MNQTSAQRGTDLSALFEEATQALAANQRGSAPSTQLQHAGDYLSQHAQSGSGQVYAQGLAQAAQ